MKEKLRADHTPKIVISMIVAVALGVAISFAMNAALDKLPIRQYFASEYTNAVWDWSNLEGRSKQELQQTADFLYMHQVNTVYVNIGGLVKTVSSTEPSVNYAEETSLISGLERYIDAMKSRNIRVFASAGDVEWSKPDQTYIPLAIQQFVFAYNNAHDAKLAGVEFDIEAYNQEQFATASMTEKELVLNEYLDLVDRLATVHQQHVTDSKDKDLEIGFAIPYWFDNENKNIQSVAWHDKTGPTLFHILDRLNELKNANVVVMAYRNAALGNDGMIFHSRTEAEYAKANAPNVRILIGVETTDVEPAKITFYGKSFTELSSEVKTMEDEFKATTPISGIAINDLEGLQKLGQKGQEF